MANWGGNANHSRMPETVYSDYTPVEGGAGGLEVCGCVSKPPSSPETPDMILNWPSVTDFTPLYDGMRAPYRELEARRARAPNASHPWSIIKPPGRRRASVRGPPVVLCAKHSETNFPLPTLWGGAGPIGACRSTPRLHFAPPHTHPTLHCRRCHFPCVNNIPDL